MTGWSSNPVGNAQPGDLIFFANTAAHPEHVGIYMGNGILAAAPDTGNYVSESPVSDFYPIVVVKHYSLPGASATQPPGPPAPISGVTNNPGTGLSTNSDWAELVLRDGGCATSANNAAVVMQRMTGEQPANKWWIGDNNHSTTPSARAAADSGATPTCTPRPAMSR